MIFTLTMNPALDRYIYIDELKPDDTVRAREIRDYPAGKGIDVSRVIKELGGVSVAVALLGGDNGRKIGEMLDKEGVIYTAIRIEEETRMNVILVLKNRRQYMISMPGAKVEREKLEMVSEILRVLVRKGDTIVISGSLPKGVAPDYYTGLIFVLRKWGVKVYFDADGENLRAGLVGEPNCVKPNIHELSRLLGREVDPNKGEEIISSAEKIIEEYGLDEMLVTLGSSGSMYISRSKVLYAHPIDVPVESAVGAGDSFLAAFVLKREEGCDVMTAFKWANAAGNAAVITPGTELCRKEDVLKLLDEVKVERIR